MLDSITHKNIMAGQMLGTGPAPCKVVRLQSKAAIPADNVLINADLMSKVTHLLSLPELAKAGTVSKAWYGFCQNERERRNVIKFSRSFGESAFFRKVRTRVEVQPSPSKVCPHELLDPSAVVPLSNGQVCVLDRCRRYPLKIFDGTGRFVRSLGALNVLGPKFMSPSAAACDPRFLYVCDGPGINKLTFSGKLLAESRHACPGDAIGIAECDDMLYVLAHDASPDTNVCDVLTFRKSSLELVHALNVNVACATGIAHMDGELFIGTQSELLAYSLEGVFLRRVTHLRVLPHQPQPFVAVDGLIFLAEGDWLRVIAAKGDAVQVVRRPNARFCSVGADGHRVLALETGSPEAAINGESVVRKVHAFNCLV
uniref:F-box domain-containing protein n=1 Tax=Chrysotila carterae TaxID=13221 RepID=A0A7S4B368_CHRCT|mmetsp:Transcript_31246/g.68351  ORF Transcript_31246/g.68351 Transcript_31246/m.68351 type:complete len:370 (-) Transcript_31246:594-1703(-)